MRTMLAPVSDSERTSLRSSTVFMIATSENEVSFAAMSAAGRPLYVQTRLTEGMPTSVYRPET
ncbi:hypothetical protein D3C80_2211690 [compost metagenome]